MQTLGFIAAISLGLVFLGSGVSKVRDLNGFVLGVFEYDLLPRPLASVVGRLLPVVEISCGAALLIGLWPRVVGLVSGLLLCSFLIGVSVNLARGRIIDCHCFAPSSSEPIGMVTVTRLGVLLVCAGLVTGRSDAVLAPPASDAGGCILLGIAVLLMLHLSRVVPVQWDVWRTKVAPGTRLFGGCVSYRHTHVSLPVEPSGFGTRSLNGVDASGATS